MTGHVTPGAVPAMDRPSIAFARFLDSMVVTAEPNDPKVEGLVLTCELCGVDVCEVEPGDTMRVLLNTALAHDCP